MPDRYYLTAADIQWLRDLRQTVSTISGDGVVNDGQRIRIMQQRQARSVSSDVFNPTVARITSSAGCGRGFYGGRQQTLNNGNGIDPAQDMKLENLFQDVNTSDDCWIANINENDFAPMGHDLNVNGTRFVWGYLAGQTSSSSSLAVRPLVICESQQLWLGVPVTLSNPMGSRGTSLPPVAATLTYTITALDGVKIADNVPVDWRFPGHVSDAGLGTRGLYYPDSQANMFKPHLLITNEVIDVGSCVPPSS
ncbi:MAG TPA: hypothetical protein VK797_22715 [Tepidisphaeraceae bacterium]|jgi:hypothetical protein|nr:hypothetical protein [Tepidisphaeraceae bacterium]